MLILFTYTFQRYYTCNTQAIGFYAVIFDAIYVSSTLSPLLYPFGITHWELSISVISKVNEYYLEMNYIIIPYFIVISSTLPCT